MGGVYRLSIGSSNAHLDHQRRAGGGSDLRAYRMGICHRHRSSKVPPRLEAPSGLRRNQEFPAILFQTSDSTVIGAIPECSSGPVSPPKEFTYFENFHRLVAILHFGVSSCRWV